MDMVVVVMTRRKRKKNNRGRCMMRASAVVERETESMVLRSSGEGMKCGEEGFADIPKN